MLENRSHLVNDSTANKGQCISEVMVIVFTLSTVSIVKTVSSSNASWCLDIINDRNFENRGLKNYFCLN